MMDVEIYLNQGRQYAKDGQYKTAIEQYDRIINSQSVEPSTKIDALYYRGCARIKCGQYEQAIKDFDSTIEGSSSSVKHIDAFYKRAYVKHLTGQYDMAIRDYQSFVAQCSDESIPKGQFSMGCTYLYLNENEHAVDCFYQAIKNESNQPLYYLYRGRAYACLGQIQEAVQDLEHVCSHSTDSYLIGLAQNELGKHVEAIESYNKALSQYPHNSDALFRRGLSHACLNDHEKAIEDYLKAVNEYDRQDRIYFRLGISNFTCNKYQEAMTNFNQSLKLASYHPDVYYARGILHYKLGRHDASIHDQRKAFQLGGGSQYYTQQLNDVMKTYNDDKKNYKICIRVGECLEQVAPYTKEPDVTHDEAKDYYQKAKKLDPAQPNAAVRLAINDFQTIDAWNRDSIQQYPNPNDIPPKTVDDYVNRQLRALENLAEAFQGDINKLSDYFTREVQKLTSLQRALNKREAFQLEISQNLQRKADLIQGTLEEFKGSEEQQQFYKTLFLNICNLFDGSRLVSSGMVDHSLTGSLSTAATGVKYGSKILQKIVEQFTPLPGGAAVETVVGGVVSGLEKWDATRITNALRVIGKLDTQAKMNEAANYMARQLAIIYKYQLERFKPSPERKDSVKSLPEVRHVKSKCCSCAEDTINKALNKPTVTVIQMLAEYATALILDTIKTFDVTLKPEEQGCCANGFCGFCRKGTAKSNKVRPRARAATIIPLTMEFLNEKLIDCVCNPGDKPVLSKLLGTLGIDKIKLTTTVLPSSDENALETSLQRPEQPKKKAWHLHEFYQKPGIELRTTVSVKAIPVGNKQKYVGDWMDTKNYYYRLATLSEQERLTDPNFDPKELGLEKETTSEIE
ncbi:unnamed protein product [Didymodactylos carnosus]|uniref:Tetratricopeptide repeat protein n=1 Tax=Didymodactylos carnosus TaxID=1234261 RepID=A0A814MLT4_9BILA|nr:unnamed protein product [Didymodactylos carnosus]CAF1080418.1 unnamed protein product [Didymodactylos carnosus]CAF3770351.1 unnamed protein product [Didymodactylos carnosus]CAF3846429.1 unnamed protein product [Didymodactylos carnosus]